MSSVVNHCHVHIILVTSSATVDPVPPVLCLWRGKDMSKLLSLITDLQCYRFCPCGKSSYKLSCTEATPTCRFPLTKTASNISWLQAAILVENYLVVEVTTVQRDVTEDPVHPVYNWSRSPAGVEPRSEKLSVPEHWRVRQSAGSCETVRSMFATESVAPGVNHASNNAWKLWTAKITNVHLDVIQVGHNLIFQNLLKLIWFRKLLSMSRGAEGLLQLWVHISLCGVRGREESEASKM